MGFVNDLTVEHCKRELQQRFIYNNALVNNCEVLNKKRWDLVKTPSISCFLHSDWSKLHWTNPFALRLVNTSFRYRFLHTDWLKLHLTSITVFIAGLNRLDQFMVCEQSYSLNLNKTFIYINTLFMQAAEALVRLHTHGSSPKIPLLADVISTNVSCTCICPFNHEITVKQPAQIRLCRIVQWKFLFNPFSPFDTMITVVYSYGT